MGHELLRLLLADPRVDSVTAVARGPLAFADSKLKTLIADFERLDDIDIPRAKVAFCCLGTTIAKAGNQEAFFTVDHDFVMHFAAACRTAGVESFGFVSALGADANSSVFYNRVKGRTENDLKKAGFQRLVIVRPSLLLGERRENRPAERAAQLLSRYFIPIMIGPLSQWRPVSGARVAMKLKSAVLDDAAAAFRLIPNEEI